MAQRIKNDFSEEIRKVQNLVEKLEDYGIYGEFYEKWKIEGIIKTFMDEFNKVKSKYKIIDDKMKRNTTKVFIFGKLSSGKTKLINGIIAEDLFVSASNHTTNCFVHIRKSDNENYKIIDKDKEEFIYQNKDEAAMKIEEISTDKNGNQMDTKECIEIFIPIDNNNKILTKTVKLIDTPGSGNIDKMKKCYQKHAFDSDIFIFVLYDDITEEEEDFFIDQVENSTAPDIFILVNKWDQTDNEHEERYKKTYDSLFSKCSKLILQFSGSKAVNVNKRIYFVSASEIFNIRINKTNIPDLNIPKQKARYNDFLRFENEISKYIQDLERNKILHYKGDIETLKMYLKKLIAELSKNISCIDFGLPLKIDKDYKKKIDIFIENCVKVECKNTLSKCEEKIKCLFTNLENENHYDANELNKKVSEHYSTIKKFIENLKNNLGNQYNQLIEKILNNQNVNTQETPVSLEKTFLKNNIKNDVQILKNFEGDLFYTSDAWMKSLLFVPVVNIISTFTHFYRVYANKNKFIEMNKKIHENDKEELKILEEIISEIEKYFTNNANDLLKQINDTKLQNDYKEYLFNIFK